MNAFGLKSAAGDFEVRFGHPPTATAEAPGRVNLIGEHTDYNDGYVLPLAIPQSTRVAVAPRADRRVRAWSAELSPNGAIEEYELGREKPGRGWIDHVQGVTATLASTGHAFPGFDVAIRSTVPIGAGLASSAALAVALLRALESLDGAPLEPRIAAAIAQRSEREFVGADVGIMDPLAALLARPDRALLIDTWSLVTRDVPLPDDAEIVVVDSGVRHRHADGGYNARREECRAACRLLGIPSLRRLPAGDSSWDRRLPEVLVRRVRHVVSENERVLAAVTALEAGDLVRLGRLLGASHASLRDDYEVTIPPVDALVLRASVEPGVFGARMTGGGFGGSVLALARKGEGRRAGERIVADYRADTGEAGRLVLPLASVDSP